MKLSSSCPLTEPIGIGATSNKSKFMNFLLGQYTVHVLFCFRAAVAVGMTAVSSKDVLEDGMRGKGILISHVYTDFLWYATLNLNLFCCLHVLKLGN